MISKEMMPRLASLARCMHRDDKHAEKEKGLI